MRPLWVLWHAYRELVVLRVLVRRYLDARDRSDPAGEHQARQQLEALLGKERP